MKILHVIRDLSPSTGGPVTALLGMARVQAARGHIVDIVATNNGVEEYQNVEGVRMHMFPLSFFVWRWSIKMGHALPILIKSADIVHIHTVWEYPTWKSSKLCRSLNKPYIIRPCGMLDNWSLSQKMFKKKIYSQLFLNSILDNAAAIHFTSDSEQINSRIHSNLNKSFVCPLGLPAAAYEDLPSPEAFFKRFPDLKGLQLILFLGRLHPKKQPELVIRAFSKLCNKNPKLHLIMAGPGSKEYIDVLRHVVRQLGLDSKVTFTGMLSGVSVQEAYRAAELFVLPSLQENFGISVAEAMAAGCPVVISNKVDLHPEIEMSEAGLVCSPDIEAVAHAMSQILEKQDLRDRMSENARRLIMTKFIWEKVICDLMNVYEDILSEKHKSKAWTWVKKNASYIRP